MPVRREGRKPPFEVKFAVWAWMVAIAALDVLGALLIFNMATGQTGDEPEPLWVPLLFGWILLLLSLVAVSFVLTLRDGDNNIRDYLSYSAVLCFVGFSWPPSWSWLILLVPVVLVGPLWLPRARRFFDDSEDESSADRSGPGIVP
jgi:hypothetical protein